MKVYYGSQTEHGPAVVVEEDGHCRGLDPRHDLRNHSTTGFAWGNGYAGGGSVQLALALAADVLGDDDSAREVYMRLKYKLIGTLADEGWVLTEDHIRTVIAAIEREHARAP